VTRTDRYAPEFLFEVMSAWSGPCAQDGVCNEDNACEYPDPDCDICGLDGICGAECDRVDLDCALGGLAGDSCGDRFDCESRVCIVAPDDGRISYCSDECDPNLAVGDQCDVPLTRCGKSSDGQDVCQYAGPTPGSQGAACTDSSECLGACDPNNAICVEVCDSNADCSDEFECRSVGGTKVCTVPEEGGCAATGSAGRANLAVIGLAFLGLLAFRRRRD
jgi:MYXO-CTERM domain-containing protein